MHRRMYYWLPATYPKISTYLHMFKMVQWHEMTGGEASAHTL